MTKRIVWRIQWQDTRRGEWRTKTDFYYTTKERADRALKEIILSQKWTGEHAIYRIAEMEQETA